MLITETIFQRSLLSGGSVAQTAEVYVEFGGGGKVDKENARRRPSEFAIVPERVRTADSGKRMPKFKIDVSATTLSMVYKGRS